MKFYKKNNFNGKTKTSLPNKIPNNFVAITMLKIGQKIIYLYIYIY